LPLLIQPFSVIPGGLRPVPVLLMENRGYGLSRGLAQVNMTVAVTFTHFLPFSGFIGLGPFSGCFLWLVTPFQ